jgi:hypothetical protein
MAAVDEIKQEINNIKIHFEKNLNNKYVKNILLKLDLSMDSKHKMNIILEHKTLYFDSKGTIEDLYLSIRAIALFIKEVRSKVLPNVSGYVGASFFSTSGNLDPNEKVLYQMAIKNYGMNIRMLAKLTYDLLINITEYDNVNFSSGPAVKIINDYEEIKNYLFQVSSEK